MIKGVTGLDVLLPHLAGVVVDAVEQMAHRLRIMVRAKAPTATCAGCGSASERVHSSYTRTLADLALAGRQVEIRLRARRWFCSNQHCATRTFAEQIDGLTARYARRTGPLRQALEHIALALAGRAGSRLANRLGLAAGRSSMLRLIRGLPDRRSAGDLTVVGVDDFAVRRGHRYGTVLVDLDTHRPIDLLPDREAATLAAWFRRHPTLQVVCRDRAGAYADAAATGAAQAIQVADRWHLWHNLAQHVEKTAAAHRRCIPPMEPAPPEPLASTTASVEAPEGHSQPSALAARTRQRHQVIHEHLAAGKAIRQIAVELKLSRGTVRRFARASTVDDLQPGPRRSTQPSILAPYVGHLQQRWADGVTNAAQIHAEIRTLGYRGGATIVREYLRPMRLGRPPRPATPTALTTRQITSVLMRRPGDLDSEEQAWLQHIRRSCAHLDQVARHVTAFATMLTTLQGENLNAWMATVDADDQPHLHSFVAGIRRDYDAVRNGLTLQHNSGPVEGHVNRIKMIKRQMYGRANFDLLRKRVLLA